MSETAKKSRAAYLTPILFALAALLSLTIFSGAAADGARQGLHVCSSVIIPSLLPFFVLSYLLSELGVPRLLARFSGALTTRLFGVSGVGASAFIMGLSGGYPLGAATVCDLYSRGDLDKKEAERLLGFCNNTGPAFIMGAAGAGVFKSAACGLLLFISHTLAALIVGALLRGKTPASGGAVSFHAARFSEAFPESVKRAALSCIAVCSFVIFFAALMGTLTATGAISAVSGRLASSFGIELSWIRAFLTGFLELGSGTAALSGFPVNGANLALASFILGFGGLSVHCQALALINAAKLSAARLFPCKLLHGLISALISAGLCALFL